MHAMVSFSTLFAAFFGGWEVVLILAVSFVLIGAKSLPGLFGTSRLERRSGADEFPLWLAQGFDIGRIPVAPGTFGSLVGVLWFALLLVPASFGLYLLGTLLGLAASVKFCGEAERILGESDPGSVVLDEIAAIPICFLPWVVLELWRLKSMPPVETFFSGRGLWMSVSIYVLFRVFDIWKPWPVRQSQNLPGGWGVTADDVLAAIYVGALSVLFVR